MRNTVSYSNAIRQSFVKLDPRVQARNPVMFVVFIGSVLTTLLGILSMTGQGEQVSSAFGKPWFVITISVWLWFTVLFANFAEALAEGRGKAQADALRQSRKDSTAKKLSPAPNLLEALIRKGDKPGANLWAETPGASLKVGDVVLVEAGDAIPADGEAVLGIASVNESAVTGESAPVIRESGGDRSAVTGGTTILSDWLLVRVTHKAGDGFIDRMIALVEGAKRQRTPNEIALHVLLCGTTIVFLFACATLLPFSQFAVAQARQGETATVVALVALLVCLIPTTIGGLLSAIGIAGMDRLIRANVIAVSGRAVEAAGDVDVLLLDKTGTITFGNRQATAFIPAEGVAEAQLAEVAQLASLADETPEGRSVIVLAKDKYGLRAREIHELKAVFVPFTAQTRMSGVDLPAGARGDTRAPGGAVRQIRKGAAAAVEAHVKALGGAWSKEVERAVDAISRAGGTPLVVSDDAKVCGVIHLKDVVKGGIKERFADLRKMGIKTVMITGDNPLTAAAIAAEAGVDDFLAQATPERKLALIREYQAGGRMVAMTGDGTNDAPALAQADVAVAMNTGTQAAKEAGNMVDLDSNPTKLIEIVKVGKQLLMTRGSLTTFSISNDVAKYFAILPAMFAPIYPGLKVLDIMRLHSAASAVLSAVIFNAVVIVALIPLALKGVKYLPVGAAAALQRNILIYGLGGLIVPFVGIKLIDLLLAACFHGL